MEHAEGGAGVTEPQFCPTCGANLRANSRRKGYVLTDKGRAVLAEIKAAKAKGEA